MALEAPGEDADLVEVVGEASLVGAQDGDVDGDVLVVLRGFGIVDGGEDVGSDEALALGVTGEGVGGVDVHHAGVDPAGAVLGVADQPPVFHRWRGRSRCGGIVGGSFDWGERFWWGGGFGGGCSGLGFGEGSAGEELELVAFGQAVEAVGVAAGFEVHVDFVADDGGGNERVFGVVGGEVLEGVEGFLGGNALFVDPADLTLFGADLDEAATVFEDSQLVAVGDGAGAVGDGSDAIAEEALLGRDVGVLGEDLGADVAAAKGEEQEEGEEDCAA